MVITRQSWADLSVLELGLVGTGLAVAAIFAPLPLYLLALTLFGLPHVLWELRWIRQTYQAAIAPLVWWLWWGVLGIQALSRCSAWLGIIPADITAWVDLLTLALLFMVAAVTAACSRTFRAGVFASLAVGFAAALLWAINTGEVVVVLVVLAIAHNFTPLLLVTTGQRFHALAAKPVLWGLFSLPVLVVLTLLVVGKSVPDTTGWWMPSEATWVQQHWASAFTALLSGLVLAQCLHYYSVLRLLPTTLVLPTASGWLVGAIGVSVGLSAYFMVDFKAARQLYAVAAGIHAWLEFPLILLLLHGLKPETAREGESKRDTRNHNT